MNRRQILRSMIAAALAPAAARAILAVDDEPAFDLIDDDVWFYYGGTPVISAGNGRPTHPAVLGSMYIQNDTGDVWTAMHKGWLKQPRPDYDTGGRVVLESGEYRVNARLDFGDDR